jgi:hypothetical protein
MKKTILFLVLISLNILSLSFAVSNYPLGPEWGEEDIVLSSQHEEAFIALHQITETETNNEKVYRAFGLMKLIYQVNGLDNKYSNNEIQSPELKQLLDELIPASRNPQTAKDYFYKGMFSYPSDSVFSSETASMYDNFNHVIDNYPDTIYAKYSYLLLAGNLSYAGRRYNDANDVLNRFIEKYGEADILACNAYYRLANNYYKLYYINKSDIQKKVEDGNQMMVYSNKILNDFPERKEMAGDILLNIAGYYSFQGDLDKSLEYYYKVFNDANHRMGSIEAAMGGLLNKSWKNKRRKEATKFLEDAKARYWHSKDIRKQYKKYKKNLEEIRLFGHDSFDMSKKNRQKYKEKKVEIDAWRKKYEASWDENFNQIAPLPVLK